MAEETPLQKAIREAKEKTAQKAKDSNPYADMDYETYLKKKGQKVSTQEPANGSKTSGTQSSTSQPEIDAAEQQNSDPFNLGSIKLGNGSKSDIGYREGGLGGSFKDNINGNYASPLEKAQSERLKEIQSAYQGDKEAIAKAQQDPIANDILQQGLGEEDFLGKGLNLSKHYLNETLRGTGKIASGLGDQILTLGVKSGLMPKEVQSAYRNEVQPGLRNHYKDQLGFDLDTRRENEYRNGTITGAIGGLAQSVPAMIMGAGGGYASSIPMFFLGQDSALESLNQSEVGRTLDEDTKAIYSSGVGLVGALLERAGIDKIFKAESGIVSKYITDKAIQNALKSGNQKISGDVLSSFLQKEVFDLSGRIAKFGTKAADGYLTEAFTGGAQETSIVGAEYLLNAATGKSVFDTEDISTWKGFINNIKRIGQAANAEGIGGGFMGVLAGVSNGSKSDFDKTLTQLKEINKALDNEQLSESSKDLLIRSKINIQNKIEADKAKIDEWFSKADKETQERIFDLGDEKIKIEEALLDPQLPESIKEDLKKQSNQIDVELSGLNKSSKKQGEADLSTKVSEASVSTDALADRLVNATTPEEIAQIQKEAELTVEEGISATIKLTEKAKPEVIKEDLVPETTYQVGDMLPSTTEDTQTFVKELLPDNKAVVGIVESGIYREETIDLPNTAENAPSKVETTQDVKITEEVTTPTEVKSTEKVIVEVGNVEYETDGTYVSEKGSGNLMPLDSDVSVKVLEKYSEIKPTETKVEGVKVTEDVKATPVEGVSGGATEGVTPTLTPNPTEEVVQPETADSGISSGDLKEENVIDLDSQKKKPKKYNKNSRTAKQIDRQPNSFNDAVNQFFIGDGKLSTEDFIAHTGFGFYKESNGKKTKLNPVETDEYLNKGSLQSGEKVTTSKELRLAKFTGKVADRKAGGIDADMILQSYIPEEFSGDQGMDGITNIVNAAANKTRGGMLKELEASDAKIQENGNEANFGYTDAEIAEMEDFERKIEGRLTDEEISSLEINNSNEIANQIYDELNSINIPKSKSDGLINLVKEFTDDKGNIDWDAIESKYFDTFVSESDVDFSLLPHEYALKQIFENGNDKFREQIEQSARIERNSGNNFNKEISETEQRTSKRAEKSIEPESEAKGSEARLDNGRAMGSNPLFGPLAEPERRSRIYQTIEASNTGGEQSSIREIEEREELEARGINPDFSKTDFRTKLREEAKANDVWLENTYLDNKDLRHNRKLQNTTENDVYINPDGKTITKVNNLSFVNGVDKNNNLNSFIDRLDAHNKIFPNTAYTIVGFMDNMDGHTSIVLEQPYVNNVSRNASQSEINNYLTDKGFKKDGTRNWSNEHEVWTNGKYELFDARPANVLKGLDGKLYFIDTVPHSVSYMNGESAENNKANESLQEPNTTSNGEVQPKSEQGDEQGESNDVQSTADTRASEGKAKIEKAKKTVKLNEKNVNKLEKEIEVMSKNIKENLIKNQENIFGTKKDNLLFNDTSGQQKIFNDKLKALREAQESLVKAKQELANLKETEGQVELTMPESKVEIDGEVVDLSETTPKQDADIIVKSTLNPFKLISFVQKGVDKLENNTTSALIPKITDMLAETLQAWRTSKNTIKNVASSVASSIFGGIARTDKDVSIKLGLIGGKNMAVYNMGKLMKSLYGIIDNNTGSLERIHVVMDPDFYQKGLEGQSNALNQNVPPNLTYNDLTAEEKMLHDELRKNLDEIHFKNYALGFIDVDTFNKHKGTYVPRMYETNELPAETQEILDAYNKQVGTKLNLNPFKKRKDLDQLSEDSKNAILKDPVYLMAKRMMELDTNSAIQNYINHVNRNNKNLVYEGPDADAPFQFVKLEGKAYGALNGKYVAGFIAEDLKGYFFVNKGLNLMYDGFKMYDRTGARQFVKKGLTVFNPFVQLGNFTSNVVFAQLGGVDFVRWFGNSPSAIKELINKGADYETLLAAGLIGTDVVTNDFTPNTTRSNSLLQQKKDKEKGGLLKKLTSPFTKASDKATQLYSGNDDYAKINAYQIYIEQGYSKDEALKKVYDAFQNYATVGKFWDVAAKTPVFGPVFVKFAADLMRITGNAVAKKPLSSALYLAGLMLIPQILKSIGASEEEDELKKELRTNRPFIPKMDLGFVNIPLVYKTKIGEINLARYITPYYFFDSGDDVEDKILPGMLDRFNPYKEVKSQGYGKGNESEIAFGQDPVLGTLYNIMLDTDFRGKSIQDPQATRFRASGLTNQEKWMNRGTHALRTWIPNGALMHDTYLNAKYGADSYGRTRTMAQTLINFAIKIQDFKESDYKKTAENQVFSIRNDLRSQVETIKNTYVTDAIERQDKQKSLLDGSLSKEDYQRSIERLDDRLKTRIEKAYEKKADIDKKLNDFNTKYKRILDE